MEVILCIFGMLVMTSSVTSWNEVWMNTTLREKFSDARHHDTNPRYKLAARNFIIQEFTKYKLDIIKQDVAYNGVNIIGVLKGAYFNTSEDRVFGIGAHYDTVRSTGGVDDNGSGVVAMLAAAQDLTDVYLRNYTLIFVAFDVEESQSGDDRCQSYSCGSMEFVPWLINFVQNGLENIQGFVVLDTVMNHNETENSQLLPFPASVLVTAFPIAAKNIISDGIQGDFLTAISRRFDAPLVMAFNESFVKSGDERFELELMIAPIDGQNLTDEQWRDPLYADFFRSDHIRFWRRGIQAVFLTDTANLRGYMEGCYHQECDNMEMITDNMLKSLAKTARALVNMADTLSPEIPRPETTTAAVSAGYSSSSETYFVLAMVFCIICRSNGI